MTREVLVVPGCMYDIVNLKARNRSEEFFLGENRSISLLQIELKSPSLEA